MNTQINICIQNDSIVAFLHEVKICERVLTAVELKAIKEHGQEKIISFTVSEMFESQLEKGLFTQNIGSNKLQSK